MTRFRIVFDEAGENPIQQAVLHRYAGQLREDSDLEVNFSGELSPFRADWPGVAPEAARGLRHIASALQPENDLQTAFIPSHVVPVRKICPTRINADIGMRGHTNRPLSLYDIFVCRNDSNEADLFKEFTNHSRAYDQVSTYFFKNTQDLPSWLDADVVQSCRIFHQRPWYSRRAPTSAKWTQLVAELIKFSLTDLSAIVMEIDAGRIRPSFLDDVKAALKGQPLNLSERHPMDSGFVYPELVPSAQQQLKLRSDEFYLVIENFKLDSISRVRPRREKVKKTGPKERKEFIAARSNNLRGFAVRKCPPMLRAIIRRARSLTR